MKKLINYLCVKPDILRAVDVVMLKTVPYLINLTASHDVECAGYSDLTLTLRPHKAPDEYPLDAKVVMGDAYNTTFALGLSSTYVHRVPFVVPMGRSSAFYDLIYRNLTEMSFGVIDRLGMSPEDFTLNPPTGCIKEIIIYVSNHASSIQFNTRDTEFKNDLPMTGDAIKKYVPVDKNSRVHPAPSGEYDETVRLARRYITEGYMLEEAYNQFPPNSYKPALPGIWNVVLDNPQLLSKKPDTHAMALRRLAGNITPAPTLTI